MKLLFERMLYFEVGGWKIRCWIPLDNKISKGEIEAYLEDFIFNTAFTNVSSDNKPDYLASYIIPDLNLNACEVLYGSNRSWGPNDGSVVYADWP